MSVIWEACAGKEWCVQIPFDGKKCFSAHACIRIIEEAGNFFLEIELAGNRQRIPIGNSCVDARYYVFVARVCMANVRATPHSLDFDVVLRLCIDASIGPIHIGECVDVYSQHVSIGFFTVEQLAKLNIDHPVSGLSRGGSAMGAEKAYAYVETGISAQALASLTKQLSAM